jgi:predicted nucleotide-binding protein (sugar kinase/HSP70/actin superfamily)
LLWITQPFFQFTTALSKTKDITVYLVFAIYNKLFDHLEKSIKQLTRKKVAWKKLMLTALRTAEEKLRQYYSKTDDIPGDIFAIGTMLAPQHKL